MFIIGIDPHKGSHTAAVLDRTDYCDRGAEIGTISTPRDPLFRFAADFTPRTWAIESASGLGALLAQQLVAAGESVVDVPPTLSARCGCSTPAAPTRPTPTTPGPPRSWRYVTPSCARSPRWIAPFAAPAGQTGTTTSPDCAPRRSADFTPCSVA